MMPSAGWIGLQKQTSFGRGSRFPVLLQPVLAVLLLVLHVAWCGPVTQPSQGRAGQVSGAGAYSRVPGSGRSSAAGTRAEPALLLTLDMLKARVDKQISSGVGPSRQFTRTAAQQPLINGQRSASRPPQKSSTSSAKNFQKSSRPTASSDQKSFRPPAKKEQKTFSQQASRFQKSSSQAASRVQKPFSRPGSRRAQKISNRLGSISRLNSRPKSSPEYETPRSGAALISRIIPDPIETNKIPPPPVKRNSTMSGEGPDAGSTSFAESNRALKANKKSAAKQRVSNVASGAGNGSKSSRVVPRPFTAFRGVPSLSVVSGVGRTKQTASRRPASGRNTLRGASRGAAASGRYTPRGTSGTGVTGNKSKKTSLIRPVTNLKLKSIPSGSRVKVTTSTFLCPLYVNEEDKFPLRLLPSTAPEGVDGPDDGCASDMVRVSLPFAPCQPLLTRGTCPPGDWILLNNKTYLGECHERPCPRGYALVSSTGLCHDLFDETICPGGRRIFVTATGESVCACPDGWEPDHCGVCRIVDQGLPRYARRSRHAPELMPSRLAG